MIVAHLWYRLHPIHPKSIHSVRVQNVGIQLVSHIVERCGMARLEVFSNSCNVLNHKSDLGALR